MRSLVEFGEMSLLLFHACAGWWTPEQNAVLNLPVDIVVVINYSICKRAPGIECMSVP